MPNVSDQTKAAVKAVFSGKPFLRDLYNHDPMPLHSMEWRALADFRGELLSATQDLLDSCQVEKRDLNAQEAIAFDEVDAIIKRVKFEMDWRDKIGARGPRELRSGRMLGAPGSEPDDEKKKRGRPMFRDLATGRELRGYRHGEPIAQNYRDSGERRILTFADFAAGVIAGRWASEEHEREARALSVGSVGAGGYLVPEPLAAQWIDLARNEAAVMRAGAITIPMDSSKLDIARLATGVTAEWKAENAAFTGSDPTFERVQLSAKTVGALVKMSAELAMDAPNIGAILETELSKGLGVALDYAALMGDGSGASPTGIYYDADRQSYIHNAVPSYLMVSHAVEAVQNFNFTPNAMLAHPRTYGELDRLKDSTNQPLLPFRSFLDLQHFPTTQVPINLDVGGSPNDQSCAFVGKFDELLLGMRINGVLIEVTRVGADGSEGAFSKYQVWVRAVLRADVKLARPKAFCVISKIEDNV